MTGKSVLVLGGTRYFGRQIVAELLSRGFEVMVLTRGNRTPPASHSGLVALQCDRKDEQAMTRILAGRTLVAVIDNICYDAGDAEAAIRLFQGRCERYLFTSTVMSYLNRYLTRIPLCEDDWRGARSTAGMLAQYGAGELEYAERKRACEAAFEAAADFPSTAFRLHNVIGADDFSGKSGAITLAMSRGGAMRLPGRPDDTYQFVAAADVARIYCGAIEMAPDRLADVYNVSNAPISQRDYVSIVAAAAGVEADISFTGGDGAWGDEGVLAPFPRNVVLDCARLNKDFDDPLTNCPTYLAAASRWYRDRDLAEAESGR